MGQLISALVPQCFPNKDACSVTAAVVLHWGESGGKPVSMLFPQCVPDFSVHIRFRRLCATLGTTTSLVFLLMLTTMSRCATQKC